MNIPKISICIPCYNVEKFVDLFFYDIKKQSFCNYEVVIVNDGSTDKTLDKINKWKDDPFSKGKLRVINQKNKGLASVRNTLLENAKGNYIFFMDSDDRIPPKALEHLYNKTNDGKIDIVMGRAKVVYKRKFSFLFFPHSGRSKKSSSKHYVKVNVCFAWGGIFKRELFENNNFLEKYSYEDIGIMPYIFLKANSFIKTRKIVYYYHRRRESLSNYSKSNMWKIVDIEEQTRYAFSKYEDENWLSSKEHKKIINGLLFQIFFPMRGLMKNYSNNKYINLLPLYSVSKFLYDKGIMLENTTTLWKHFFYFYFFSMYHKSLSPILKNKNFLKKLKFVELENLINKRNCFTFINKVSINKELIKKNKKVIFCTYEESQYENCLQGIKIKKIDNSILKKYIHFIDMRGIKKISNADLKIISKIDDRIIVFINKNLKINIEKINFIRVD